MKAKKRHKQIAAVYHVFRMDRKANQKNRGGSDLIILNGDR